MCPPAALAALSLVVGAAQGMVGYMGQQQQYKAQMEAYETNVENSSKATVRDWGNTQLRITQEGKAATQKKFEAGIEASKAAATASVAAGEGGVSGLSVDYLLSDLYGQKGRYNDSVDSNLQMTRDYLSAEMEGQRARGQNQINSMPIPEKPSFAATLVNIFGSAVSAGSQFQQNR